MLDSKCPEVYIEANIDLYLSVYDNLCGMNQIHILKISYLLLLLVKRFQILYFIRSDPMVPSVPRG